MSLDKKQEPLAPYTTWHIGGIADRYFRPDNIESLSSFLSTLPENEPLTFLGLGSNVLIADEGIRGTVIHMLSFDKGLEGILIEKTDPHHKFVRVKAGVPCAKLAKFCAKEGLIGAEFFAGIPGTIGGALKMNAGAFGGETWNHVESVTTIDRKGNLKTRTPKEYEIAYRSVKPRFHNTAQNSQTAMPEQVSQTEHNISSHQEWFVEAIFKFALGDPKNTSEKIKGLLKRRNESQPIGTFSGGSTFKNPPNDYVGRLIEASNLKGLRQGGAYISDKHANFIINSGEATAQDVIALMNIILTRVFEDHNIALESEVCLLGFPTSPLKKVP